MNSDPNCLFCKIIKGEIPATKVFEDEYFVAFLDIEPVNPGHTLLVPKDHERNILETPDDSLSLMGSYIKKISQAVKAGTKAEGINIILNNEPAAGQVIFHTHIHIIPRFLDDGYEHWHGTKKPTEAESAEIQSSIEQAL